LSSRSVRKLDRATTHALAERLIHGRHEIGGVDRIFGHYAAQTPERGGRLTAGDFTATRKMALLK
jgi:hypothetical protein